ncbi:MAG: NAD-dependent epimerase/dehydratase family protein [Isosphaeraceae bacterium]
MSNAGKGVRVLVTGATGLLGSHIAEKLVAQGHPVRALVRSAGRTAFLEGLGVEILRGDLTSPADCERALDGCALVFHCAAKVGDWGAWKEFQVGCLDATRTLAEAASRAGVERFVHISSTSAYGHPPEGSPPIDETTPLGQNVWVMDPYTWSKVESERLLWEVAEAGRLRLSVIRPSWLFGERDRTTIPRLIQEFRWNRVTIVGKGDNPLSAVYAGVVADAALLAARDPNSVGEAYNITSHRRITQREFWDILADTLGEPRVTWRYPYWYAFYGGFSLELRDRLRGRAKPPRVTRYGAWLLGRNLEYSTEKARARLGWTPALSYEESLARTIAWFKADAANRIPHDPMPPLVRLWSLFGSPRTGPRSVPVPARPAAPGAGAGLPEPSEPSATG